MRKTIFFLIVILIFSCNTESKQEKEISKINVEFEIERFDQLFGETSEENLPKLIQAYPFLFSKSIPDSIWINRLNDSLQIELRNEVKNTFRDFEPQYSEIENLFKHLKYYNKTFREPRVITVISDVDYRNKVKVTDSIVLIGLDTYLGKEHKFYQNIHDYIKQNLDISQIVPDLAQQYAYKSIYQERPKTLLDEMIYYGKELYYKDVMIPFKSDAKKIGYTKEDLVWAQDNEQYIWKHFVENELLYDTNPKLVIKFINPSPFSKFGLQLDSESPGQLGRYIGWQIVKSYMTKNDTSLENMLRAAPVEIFSNSKYKPKK